MIKLSSARRYAKTLIEIAQETGQMEKFSADMNILRQIIDNIPEFMQFIISPTIDINVRKETVKDILKKHNINDLIINLVLLVLDSGKAKLLPYICKLYQELEDFYLGRVRGLVRVPISISNEDLDLIKQKLEEKLNKKVILTTEIEPSLIGGIWVKVGDLIFDGTVRRQLEILKENLIKG
ncbi:MAG: ATP synthase F1 subunit delta [Proteobacteria bacterium]|nr:ATP synthase F1 subunit delta [Pseudomonadota bacterium]